LCEVPLFRHERRHEQLGPEAKVHARRRRHLHQAARRRSLPATRRKLPQTRSRPPLQRELGSHRRRASAPATSSTPQAKFSFTTGASKAPVRRAFTTQPSSTPSP
jgi:hypothetical protein